LTAAADAARRSAMSSSQPPTPPAPDDKSDLDQLARHVLHSLHWVYGTGLSLLFAGILIAVVSAQLATSSWEMAGLLLMALALFIMLAVPGLLIALGHPWGTGWRLMWTTWSAHPRLAGLTMVWASIVLSGWLTAAILLRLTFTLQQAMLLTLAVCLVALAPPLALRLFDRRR
jgi:hypothetical protein